MQVEYWTGRGGSTLRLHHNEIKMKVKTRKKINKINKKEHDRLGSSNVVRTKHFGYGQKTGAANKGRSLSKEEIDLIMMGAK